MSIFDAEAIEAAAQAVRNEVGCTLDDGCAMCKESAVAALDAAVASLRERGKLRDDMAHENHFSKQWVNIGHGEDESLFPVAIIRMEPKP